MPVKADGTTPVPCASCEVQWYPDRLDERGECHECARRRASGLPERWTYEVAVTVTVDMDLDAELDRRDGDENLIREEALRSIASTPPSFHETRITGWWPAIAGEVAIDAR